MTNCRNSIVVPTNRLPRTRYSIILLFIARHHSLCAHRGRYPMEKYLKKQIHKNKHREMSHVIARRFHETPCERNSAASSRFHRAARRPFYARGIQVFARRRRDLSIFVFFPVRPQRGLAGFRSFIVVSA